MTIFDLITNFIEQLIIFDFIKCYSNINSKFKSLLLFIFVAIGTILVTITNISYEFEGLFKVAFIGNSFLFCYMYIDNSFAEKLFISIYPYVMISIINGFLTIVSCVILFNKIDFKLLADSVYFVPVIILSKILLFISLKITANIRIKYTYSVKNREIMYLISLVICIQIFFIFIERFLYTNSVDMLEIIGIVSILLFLIIIIVYYFFDNLKRESDQQKQMLNEQMVNFEEKRYTEMKEMSNSISKLKHNLKHVLINIENKIKENKLDEAEEDLHSYMGEINKINVFRNFDSNVLDFLLNKVINEAEEKKYCFKYSVNLKRELIINDNDYMILLGNALENAIQYAEEKREIEVMIQQKNEFALFVVSNTVSAEFNLENLNYSNKGKGHGYGVKSMFEIVDKNNGFLSYKIENNRLICSILVPLS